MLLDCEWGNGPKFIGREAECADDLSRIWRCSIERTASDDKACRYDAFATRDGRIVSVIEIKSRDMSTDDLLKYGSLLISESKIVAGSEQSRIHGVPFIVVAGLDDGAIVYWTMTTAEGRRTFPYQIEWRKTQATSNGGSKMDWVALLPCGRMKYAREANSLVPSAG